MSSTAPALRARVPRLAGAALERARLTVVPKRTRPISATSVRQRTTMLDGDPLCR